MWRERRVTKLVLKREIWEQVGNANRSGLRLPNCFDSTRLREPAPRDWSLDRHARQRGSRGKCDTPLTDVPSRTQMVASRNFDATLS